MTYILKVALLSLVLITGTGFTVNANPSVLDKDTILIAECLAALEVPIFEIERLNRKRKQETGSEFSYVETKEAVKMAKVLGSQYWKFVQVKDIISRKRFGDYNVTLDPYKSYRASFNKVYNKSVDGYKNQDDDGFDLKEAFKDGLKCSNNLDVLVDKYNAK